MSKHSMSSVSHRLPMDALRSGTWPALDQPAQVQQDQCEPLSRVSFHQFQSHEQFLGNICGRRAIPGAPERFNFPVRMDVRTSIHSSMVSNDDLQNQDRLTRSPHHQLRSDPRQAFSFGIAVDGTGLRVCLECRVAPFNFPPIDWLEVCQ